MYTAKLLSIPFGLEKAVPLLKFGKRIKIDLGKVIMEQSPKKQFFFLEAATVGLRADVHNYSMLLEKGQFNAGLDLLKSVFFHTVYPTNLLLDNQKTIRSQAFLIWIANAPHPGPVWPEISQAKLDDHTLTVMLFNMNRWQFLKYLLLNKSKLQPIFPRVTKFKVKEVVLKSNRTQWLQIGETPILWQRGTSASISICPNSLQVIAGYPAKVPLAFTPKDKSVCP